LKSFLNEFKRNLLFIHCTRVSPFTTVARAHYLPQSDFEIPSEKKVLEVDIFFRKKCVFFEDDRSCLISHLLFSAVEFPLTTTRGVFKKYKVFGRHF